MALPGPAAAVAVGQGAAWVLLKQGSLLRVDPDRHRVTGRLAGRLSAVARGLVWSYCCRQGDHFMGFGRVDARRLSPRPPLVVTDASGRRQPVGWLAVGPTDAERVVLQRYMDAHDRADVAAFTALLTEDARQAMPPYLWWYEGRDAVATIFARYIDPGSPDYPGHLRLVPTAANRQPAAAGYLRRPGDTEYRLFGLDVLEGQDGLVAGIVSFGVDLLAAFGLPQTL